MVGNKRTEREISSSLYTHMVQDNHIIPIRISIRIEVETPVILNPTRSDSRDRLNETGAGLMSISSYWSRDLMGGREIVGRGIREEFMYRSD